MKVLVIGSGGREHALVWKIAQSPLVDKLYAAPGNAGMADLSECVPIAAEDIGSLVKFAAEQKADLVLVGPEAPLAAGIVDEMGRRGVRTFGPSKAAAELEASKAFAKEIMRKHAIPTPVSRTFGDEKEAHAYINEATFNVVVKADGLAAGKGAIVCPTKEAAHEAVVRIMGDREFGPAGDRVVIEECLIGEEASLLAFTDGRTIMTMESAQDHKRVYDGDEGENTGGMGAYSPAPVITPAVYRQVESKILVPIVHGMNREGRRYRGVLYAGLMITGSGPMVLEFNVRFGDPETQPLVMRMKGDLVPVLLGVIDGKLQDCTLDWRPASSVCVVMASGGYPNKYRKGYPISGLESLKGRKDVVAFHAGTKREDGRVVTNGGRVLGVTALGRDVAEAQQKAYAAVRQIAFQDAHYRTDIAARAVRR